MEVRCDVRRAFTICFALERLGAYLHHCHLKALLHPKGTPVS